MNYTSNGTLADIAMRIGRAQRILITAHEKPDGDAIGSILAMTRALRTLDKHAQPAIAGPLEPCMATLAHDVTLLRLEDQLPDDHYDAVLVVDTGAWSQLATIEPWLRARHDIVVGIDHHSHGDDVASLRYVDPSAASTTQILLDLIKALGCRITTDIAEPLFVGLATDTGWFRHANADARAFATAAELLAHGVNKAALYQQIEESHRPARLFIEARALRSLTITHDDAVSMMSLTQDDLRDAGGSLEDLTGIVNLPMVVGSVRVSVLLVELDDGRTKISLRSKPATPGHPTLIDVNEVAQQVGGGGHKHAAGGRVDANLEDARARIAEVLDAVMLGCHG